MKPGYDCDTFFLNFIAQNNGRSPSFGEFALYFQDKWQPSELVVQWNGYEDTEDDWDRLHLPILHRVGTFHNGLYFSLRDHKWIGSFSEGYVAGETITRQMYQPLDTDIQATSYEELLLKIGKMHHDKDERTWYAELYAKTLKAAANYIAEKHEQVAA